MEMPVCSNLIESYLVCTLKGMKSATVPFMWLCFDWCARGCFKCVWLVLLLDVVVACCPS
jgi:hypothetical protein